MRRRSFPQIAWQLVHDTVIAHAGALDGRPGAIVIAGTGSVAYARNAAGQTALAGGWGYLFGDEGSAFAFARDAIADAARDLDNGEQSELAPAILRYFSDTSLRTLVRAFYTGQLSRRDLASFAPVLLDLAQNGSERASSYVRDAAADLVLLANRAAERCGLKETEVAFLGGLTKSALLMRWIDEALQNVPGLHRVAARRDGAEGALLLAYRRA